MDNEATLRRIYDSINAGDLEGFGDQLADDYVEHEATPNRDKTKKGSQELLKMMKAGFPDLRFEAEDVIASGDKVVARARVVGTNTGSFMGMPPTGRHVEVQAVDIVRVGEDGLVREHWGVLDSLSMMQQLGIVPEGPSA